MWRSTLTFWGAMALFLGAALVPAQTKKKSMLPPIDEAAPKKFETATLALG